MNSEKVPGRQSAGKRLRHRLAMLTAAALAVTGLATLTGPSASAAGPASAATATAAPAVAATEDQAHGVHLHDATFSDLYQSADGTAHVQGTASCTINGTTAPCAFTATATATATAGGKGTGSFTLTYNSTTVGGTILSGHVRPGPSRRRRTRPW